MRRRWRAQELQCGGGARVRVRANSCVGLRSMRAQELQCAGGACMRAHASTCECDQERGCETELPVKPRWM